MATFYTFFVFWVWLGLVLLVLLTIPFPLMVREQLVRVVHHFLTMRITVFNLSASFLSVAFAVSTMLLGIAYHDMQKRADHADERLGGAKALTLKWRAERNFWIALTGFVLYWCATGGFGAAHAQRADAGCTRTCCGRSQGSVPVCGAGPRADRSAAGARGGGGGAPATVAGRALGAWSVCSRGRPR